jgi:soluble lytic murein transglycosylase
VTLSSLPARSTSARLLAGASLAGLLALAPSAWIAAQGNPAPDPDAVIAEASAALAQDRPYRASRLLMRLVRAPGEKEPGLLLLAANAAARWEGWGTVVRLLADQAWLDRLEGGQGRALLARARVERGEDAVADAQAALLSASPGDSGARTVTLARAYDRMQLRDSAAAAYNRAAAQLPVVDDWLLLRAAGVLADSAARSALYQEVSIPAAVPRIRWTEALARERSGDEAGAARLYDELGAVISAARLRLADSPDAAERTAIRSTLVAALSRPSADDARDAIEILDRSFAPLTKGEELAVARRAAGVGLSARAALGFSRSRPLADPDQHAYGMALARLGRHREAMTAFAAVKSPQLRAQALYQRARSVLRSSGRGAAIAALRRVARGDIRDSSTAATAGFLAADLLVDQGDEIAARTAYLEVARRFPTTVFGSRAALLAAIIELGRRGARDAGRELDKLAERPGDRSEMAAALYWAGRAHAATGDSAGARARWQAVVDRFPQSYYALPARSRLGVEPPAPPEPAPVQPPAEETVRALDRAALLERLGLRVEARFELDRVSREAEAAPATIAATASALAAMGQTSRAYRLALRVNDPGLIRLTFPIPRSADLFDEAKAAGVDPLLAAALIRQESEFNPAARSPADARGLMQVVPSVGAAYARANGITEWDVSLLYQPEINVHFGLAHLAVSLRRSPHLAHALAAYNAGTRPADVWAAFPGARSDPELFIERIQYAETREYVRRLLRYQAIYRSLYPTPR